jgi:glycosyltransferase involved in cell wall biosynthesis
MADNEKTISVVIPVFNEEDTLPELHRRLCSALASVGEHYEIIYVDDGSSDGSFPLLAALCRSDPRVRLISFSRNFGHQTSMPD